MEVVTNNVKETYELAVCVADKLQGGEIILLDGELGTGKTTFTKGLAKALDIPEEVTSPTFVLMKEYKGRLDLYHFDMYRIEDVGELEELGFDDYFHSNGVCVIEWNKIKDFSQPTINIQITRLSDNSRRFYIK